MLVDRLLGSWVMVSEAELGYSVESVLLYTIN